MEPGKKYLDIFKENINKALNNNDKVYSDFIDIPVDSIINKLINNKTLTNDDKYKIENILYNFGFEIPANSSEPDIQKYFREKFQYTNPTHRGILLGLLLNEKNNLLEPFIPLQNFPEEDRKVLKITKNWQKDLLDLLKKTETVSQHELNTDVDTNEDIVLDMDVDTDVNTDINVNVYDEDDDDGVYDEDEDEDEDIYDEYVYDDEDDDVYDENEDNHEDEDNHENINVQVCKKKDELYILDV
jgi:hypothetical protein